MAALKSRLPIAPVEIAQGTLKHCRSWEALGLSISVPGTQRCAGFLAGLCGKSGGWSQSILTDVRHTTEMIMPTLFRCRSRHKHRRGHC
jgi:hypothetical protein